MYMYNAETKVKVNIEYWSIIFVSKMVHWTPQVKEVVVWLHTTLFSKNRFGKRSVVWFHTTLFSLKYWWKKLWCDITPHFFSKHHFGKKCGVVSHHTFFQNGVLKKKCGVDWIGKRLAAVCHHTTCLLLAKLLVWLSYIGYYVELKRQTRIGLQEPW